MLEKETIKWDLKRIKAISAKEVVCYGVCHILREKTTQPPWNVVEIVDKKQYWKMRKLKSIIYIDLSVCCINVRVFFDKMLRIPPTPLWRKIPKVVWVEVNGTIRFSPVVGINQLSRIVSIFCHHLM